MQSTVNCGGTTPFWDEVALACVTQDPAQARKGNGSATCQAGNPSTKHPITIGTGNKWLAQTDAAGTLSFKRYYNSNDAAADNLLGKGWRSTYGQKLIFGATNDVVDALHSDGKLVRFALINGSYTSDADINDRLYQETDTSGALTGYRLDASDGSTERYNTVGRLTDIADAMGQTTTISYGNASHPLSINDAWGHTLTFTYGTGLDFNHVIAVTDASGRQTGYSYDANANLTTVTYPDGKTTTYLYNEAANTSRANLPGALTGIVDENNMRFATYRYDATGKAVSEFLSDGVDPSQLVFGINSTTVIDALGSSRTYAFQNVLGIQKTTGVSQPGGSGCSANASAIAYDAAGNVASRDDFQGQRSCFIYDAKNQEITQVEGLANTVDCATVVPANATLPANARRVTTAYHPDWRIPTVKTAPGTITTGIYHGQPDPFNGNTPANCTPAANLPNGKPLPLLCKQVTQAILSSGPLDTTTANTVTQYTYDSAGKVLTAKDSLNRTTSYTYYSDTAFTGTDPNAVGHTIGDLQTITNPAGFVTTFNSYDKAGRILKTTDPKGIVTDIAYTPRGWVNTVTTTAPGQSARTTTYTFDAVGQLTGVSNPDGTSLAYTYDAAHRLIGATDAKGNSVTYTLDNMGNRIKEDIKDPTGVLQRSINRSFDALNRLQQVSGAVQ